MKKTSLLAAAALLALAAPAFAADYGTNANVNADVNASANTNAGGDVSTKTKVETNTEQKAKGGYKEERNTLSDQKDAAGTETKDTTKAKVDEDAKGNVEKSVETKHTVDPKGLMNEKTTETSVKEEIKNGKHKVHKVKKVNGKKVIDLNEESNANGNVTTNTSAPSGQE